MVNTIDGNIDIVVAVSTTTAADKGLAWSICDEYINSNHGGNAG